MDKDRRKEIERVAEAMQTGEQRWEDEWWVEVVEELIAELEAAQEIMRGFCINCEQCDKNTPSAICAGHLRDLHFALLGGK